MTTAARQARGATDRGPSTGAPAATRALSAPRGTLPLAGIAVTSRTNAEAGSVDQTERVRGGHRHTPGCGHLREASAAGPPHPRDDHARPRRSVVQLRALVGAVDDPAEVEAERVAHAVVVIGSRADVVPTPRLRPLAQSIDTLRRVPSDDERIGFAGGRLGTTAQATLTASAGSGSPIPLEAKERLEDAFDADFSGVRLHADGTAAALNRTMGASAFTYGRDIYFRDGLPDTGSGPGLHLLAHELTHTLQQGAVRRRTDPPTAEAGEVPVVRRFVRVVDRSGGSEDLLAVLERFGVRSNADKRRWYTSSISKNRLRGRYGYDRFAGFLSPYNDMAVHVSSGLDALTFDELNGAVASAINTRLLSIGLDRGHSSIGRITLMSRTSFPAAVKASFDKARAIRTIGAEGGPTLAPRDVHLRHLVMGSWFRALPAMIGEAELDDAARERIGKRVAALVPRVAPLAGEPSAASSNDLGSDSQLLAVLLHNLLPNLNAGEGPENVLIGFMSHGLSNLAEDIRTSGTAIQREDAASLIGEAVDRVTLVGQEHRDAFVTQVAPAASFLAVLAEYVSDDIDLVEPDQLSAALHEFAYNLGMDLLKREEGRATSMQSVSLLQAQQALLPVGDALYSMIRVAQLGKLDATQIDKLLNAIEHATTLFEQALQRTTP